MLNAVDRLMSLRVKDVMARSAVAVTQQMAIREVVDIFRADELSAAPVIDKNGKCVGVISAVDFFKEVSPTAGELSQAGGQARVQDLMTREANTTSPRVPLLEAARIMCESHIHRMPVIDEDGNIAGVISTMDIVAAMMNAIDEMKGQ